MALVVTTQALIDEIRLLSNLKRNNYFTDVDILRFVNDAKDKLFDLIVETYEHYFVKTFDFTLANGVATNALPTDFYKADLLEVNPGTAQRSTVPMLSNYLQRNDGASALNVYYGPGQDRRYFVEGDHLLMLGNVTDGVYRLYYTPLIADLAFPLPVDVTSTSDMDVTVVCPYAIDAAGTVVSLTADSFGLQVPVANPPLGMDNYLPVVGDTIFFASVDAPTSPIHMGVYQYSGLVATGSVLVYSFNRVSTPVNLLSGQDIDPGFKIRILKGAQWAGSVLRCMSDWKIGTNSVEFLGTGRAVGSVGGNYLFFENGPFTQEALFENGETTWVGATITIQGELNNSNVAWPIGSVAGNQYAFISPIPNPPGVIVDFPIATDATVTVAFADKIYQLPLQLVPWALFIKVHAARTIRAARQQDTSQLDIQMASEEKRVMKLAANRTEDVVEAPYTRRRGGRYLGGC